jgi:hypothetical protein
MIHPFMAGALDISLGATPGKGWMTCSFERRIRKRLGKSVLCPKEYFLSVLMSWQNQKADWVAQPRSWMWSFAFSQARCEFHLHHQLTVQPEASHLTSLSPTSSISKTELWIPVLLAQLLRRKKIMLSAWYRACHLKHTETQWTALLPSEACNNEIVFI